MKDRHLAAIGNWWGLSREEAWYNNARWRFGHRVVGRGSGGGRKENV